MFRRISDFNLNRSYNLREMQISIEIIFPFSIGHSAGRQLRLIITIFVCLGYVFCMLFYMFYVSQAGSLSVEADMLFNEAIIFVKFSANILKIKIGFRCELSLFLH